MGNQNPPQSPEDEAAGYDAKTRAAEAQDKYHKTLDAINNPPSVVEALTQAKSKAEEKLSEAEQRDRDRAQKDQEAANKRAEEAQRKAEEAEQARKAAEEQLQAQQYQMLLEKIEELKVSQKPINEQFTEYFAFAETLADKFGFQKPGVVQPQSENPQIALEIAKINAESAQKQREWELQMEESRRKWDLELIKLKDNREIEQAKLAQESERTKALFSFPQILGASLAQGLVDKTAQPSGGGIAQEAPPQTFTITCNEGESGEVDCPVCAARNKANSIGIGPTTVIAHCVGCGSEFKVERGKPAETPEPKTPRKRVK